MEVVPIGLDLSPAMLRQARIHDGHAGPRARHLVGAIETLPFRAASCDVMTCFNAVHHVDLARFAGEASRVLTPSGQLIVYTRTPEQNRRTIWGSPLSGVRGAGNEAPRGQRRASGPAGHRSLRVGSRADGPRGRSPHPCLDSSNKPPTITIRPSDCMQTTPSARRSTPSASAWVRRSATRRASRMTMTTCW